MVTYSVCVLIMQLEDLNEKFVLARDEIECCHEESETVYYDETVAEARKLVEECTSKWQALLDKLPEDERGKLQRSMGMKMEQLKVCMPFL
jgi:hypothetical protein